MYFLFSLTNRQIEETLPHGFIGVYNKKIKCYIHKYSEFIFIHSFFPFSKQYDNMTKRVKKIVTECFKTTENLKRLNVMSKKEMFSLPIIHHY